MLALLDEIAARQATRARLIRRLFATFHPLGMVAGVGGDTDEIRLRLGVGRLLQVALRPSFPRTLPFLTLYTAGNNQAVRKEEVRKAEVFDVHDRSTEALTAGLVQYVIRLLVE